MLLLYVLFLLSVVVLVWAAWAIAHSIRKRHRETPPRDAEHHEDPL